MIPEGWEVVRLGELLEYEQPTKYLVRSAEYEDSGPTPVLTAGKSFILGYTFETEGVYDKGPTILFDDFTTATQWVNFPFKVKSSACKMLTTRDPDVSLRFVYEMMATISYVPADHMRHWIGIASHWSVAVPRPAEQKAIAEALSDADALVESLDALIAKKRDMKHAAMQQLLTGRTRLPGFNAAWREVRLGEIAEIISGGTPSTAVGSYWGGDIPWCTPTDITSCESNYLFETERKITPAGLAGSAASLLPPGSLLLCTRATVGDVRIAGRAIATNQGFKSLVVNSQANSKFVYFVLQTLRPAMIEKSSGSTFLELGKNDLSNIVALMPPLKEQEAIAEVLSDMDAEIDALVAQREKAELVKQGMMQELLSGRVRLV